MEGLTHRLARPEDLDGLRALMRRSINQLQNGYLTPAQVAASHRVMGLDAQLIEDRTYYVVEHGGVLAGCGGWSWRATLYGGDDSIVARHPAALDPARDAAKIRAMYTDPAFARRGVGKMILQLCEDAARAAGFGRTEMMATLAGEPFYRSHGYRPVESVRSDPIGAVRVPLLRMEKSLWSRPTNGLCKAPNRC
jgi:GNAT superfamily N-acetyltransferase